VEDHNLLNVYQGAINKLRREVIHSFFQGQTRILGYKILLRRCEKFEVKVKLSCPSSAEVKNAWSYTFTPPISLHGVVLSQAQGQLFLLYLRFN